ncbi:ankycorbin [Lingula anatina]|uniref:Ankycorbin n=1 Tax=Lingula anatina TaxID=7574 RepID=A0A1S3I8K2_LINAN|nr:ankycorbin [Lingula anatina]|eukprot:XP_013394577.1 ankycorbin [Lingula anatina]
MSSSDGEGPPAGATPLMMACQAGNDAQVKNCIKNKPEMVTQKEAMGRTALHYCAETENVRCAELLLAAAPELLNEKDADGYSTLHLAVQISNKPLFQLLIQRGANVNAVDNEKHTAVHWAAVCGNAEMLELLIAQKANPSTPDSHTAYPIHYAAQMCGSDEAVGIKIMSKLLSKGVPVDCIDQDERQPLLWAASGGSCKACKVLIEAGAKVESSDKDGLTALHCASSRGHADTIFTLVTECSAKVDSLDKNGCTPLFYSLTMLHLHCANILLELGADPNHQDKKGRSPAHCSAAKGSIPGLELLSTQHGDLWLRNMKGDCPIHEAAQGMHVDTVLYLLKLMEGQANLANKDGRTCLHIAATNNDLQMCKTLIQHGANVNITMKHKNKHVSPLDAALARDSTECATYLRSRGAATGDKVINCAARSIQKNWNFHKEKIMQKRSTAHPPGKMESLPPEKQSNKMSPRSDTEIKSPRLLADNNSRANNINSKQRKEQVHFKNTLGGQTQPNDQYSQHARTTPKPKSAAGDAVKTGPKSTKDKTLTQHKNNTAPKPVQQAQTPKIGEKYYQPKSSIGEKVWKSVKIYEFKRQASHNLVKFKRLQMMSGTPSQDEGVLVNKLMKLQETADGEIDVEAIANWDAYLKEQIKALSVTTKNKKIQNLSASLEKEFEQEAIKSKMKADDEMKKHEEHQQKIEAQDEMDKQIAETALSQALERTNSMYECVNSRASSALQRARESNFHLNENMKIRRAERLSKSPRSDNDSPRDRDQRGKNKTEATRAENGTPLENESESAATHCEVKEGGNSNEMGHPGRSPRENKENKEFIYEEPLPCPCNSQKFSLPIINQEGSRKSRKAIMEERRRVHEEWRNTQLSRREKSLFSAYAPLCIPKEDAGTPGGKKKLRTKSAPPRSSLNFDNMAEKHELDQMDHALPSVSTYPSRPSTSVGHHRSRTPSSTPDCEDLQTEMIMTPNGIVKKKLDSQGKDPSSLSRASTPAHGNFSPRYDGRLRPRSSLVFMDPDTYEEKKKQEQKNKNKNKTDADSSETQEVPAEVAAES